MGERVWPQRRWQVWLASLVAVWKQMDARNLSLISAGVAFYALLSLFPSVTALVSVWGLFFDPVALQEQLATVESFVPESAFGIIEGQVNDLVEAGSRALSWAGGLALLVAFWSAKNGVSALTRGLNAVYEESNRSGVWHTINAILLTVVLILAAAVFAGLLVVLPIALSFVPLGPLAENAIRGAKWLAVIGMLIGVIGLIYRYAPNRRAARVPWLSPGAVAATLVWTMVSLGFTLYIENFANYNEVYGSLGAVIALLFWFYISALVVLLGASLNAELERRTRQDSTVGEDLPLGERGAAVADEFEPVN